MFKILQNQASKYKLILFFTIVFIFFLRPLSGDGDFFHHINTGRYVLEHLKLPVVDDFTFTANNLPWISYSWASGVLFYIVYINLGDLGIALLLSTVAVATIFIMYLILESFQIENKVSLVILALVSCNLSIRWPNRPEIFTYLFLVSIILIETKRLIHPKLLFFYPVILLMWSIFYGNSTFIGIILLILFSFKQYYLSNFKLLIKNRNLYILTAFAIVLSFFNGYGLKTVFYIFYIPGIAKFQGEWAGIADTFKTAPLDYLLTFQYQILIFLIYVTIFLIVFCVSFKKILRYKLLFLLSLVLILPFFAFRQTGLSIVLSAPFLAVLVNNQTKSKKRIILLLIIIATLLSADISLWIRPVKFNQNLKPPETPLIKFLKNNHLSGNVFNNQQLGSYLTFYLYPDIKVFVDTRDDLFLPTAVFKDLFSGKDIRSIIKKYPIDLIVADFADGGSFYQPLFYFPDWTIVYLNGREFVAVTKKTAEELKLDKLDAIDPFFKNGAKSKLEQEALKQYLSFPDNDIFVAWLDLDLKKYDEALKVINHLTIESGPKGVFDSIQKNQLLFRLYLNKNDCLKAKYYLDKMVEQSKNKLIFTPDKSLPNDSNHDYQTYQFKCQGKTN